MPVLEPSSSPATDPRLASTYGRLLTFVPTPADAPPLRPGNVTVVLDTAWTPGPGERPDVIGLRPAFAAAVEGHDLFGESLRLLDAWADAGGLADLIDVEGVTYWYRLRENLWHLVHERLLWRYALAQLESDGAFTAVSVPAVEDALIDVVRGLGRPVHVTRETDEVDPGPAAERTPGRSRLVPPVLRRLFRWIRPGRSVSAAAERRRWDSFLGERLARLARLDGPRVVVLTLPSSYQRIGARDGGQRRDPNLGAVIPALRDGGFEPITLGWGMARGRDDDHALVQQDERLLPSYLLQTRYGRPADETRAQRAVEAVLRRLDALSPPPLSLDGADIAAVMTARLRDLAERVVATDVRELARVERFFGETRPSALLMTQEGHRIPWLLAGARAGIPTFALQHGVLYPAHPGYANRRHPHLVRPTCTFVFGAYEGRVLESLGYGDGQVEVAGSPRLDLDAEPGASPQDDDRDRVRTELGIGRDERMLVVSTVHTPFVRRSHLVHMLERCLSGPLDGIHVVIKQHPGERDDGPYRALLDGLARAGGYAPPALTVVKDMDLYRLLRAADAHLGLHSTVLTDAVVAGTCNLIAAVEASGDLLGYVAAGVARPVRNAAELRAALDDPRPPDAAARRAFIDDHFRPGKASPRIAAAIRASLDGPVMSAAVELA